MNANLSVSKLSKELVDKLINNSKDNHKEEILNKLTNIKALYEHMSKYYQSTKINNEIPLK